MKGEQRLTKPAQFELVYSKGRSWVDRLVVIKALPNYLDVSRYGFSVGRRVGKAVVRNRVKRLLREIMRKTSVKAGWDIIIIARPPISTVSYWGLENSVKRLLIRGGLLATDNEDACSGAN